MKVKALGAVLAKRFGIALAEPLVPPHPTLGDVDSAAALAEYQAGKRAYKAQLRARSATGLATRPGSFLASASHAPGSEERPLRAPPHPSSAGSTASSRARRRSR